MVSTSGSTASGGDAVDGVPGSVATGRFVVSTAGFTASGGDATDARRSPKGYVELALRLRRPVQRPAIVAANSVASSYSSASESDRQYCYLTPDDQAHFDNGDEAYAVVL